MFKIINTLEILSKLTIIQENNIIIKLCSLHTIIKKDLFKIQV